MGRVQTRLARCLLIPCAGAAIPIYVLFNLLKHQNHHLALTFSTLMYLREIL